MSTPPQPSLNTIFIPDISYIHIYIKRENHPQFKTLLVTSGMRWTTPAFLLFLYQVQRQLKCFPRICHRPVSTTLHPSREQLHRLFILPRRPTSEARPIKVSHFCPNACHLTQINQKHPSCLALFFMCHLSWFLRLCSITFLTSNEEWFFGGGGIMMWSPGQGFKWNAHFGAESIDKKRRGCEGSQDKTMR